eukprot:TRINITY_DN8133_c0_g1_i1.p1 TRINITY_DN8133_c0_g1~~TRINITY_DN8133_c0_g1_i1.p1  ORF type:complete len:296 (-),score=25.43 TRINITY_DN8133_c0_g1_i1:129-1016(-)
MEFFKDILGICCLRRSRGEDSKQRQESLQPQKNAKALPDEAIHTNECVNNKEVKKKFDLFSESDLKTECLVKSSLRKRKLERSQTPRRIKFWSKEEDNALQLAVQRFKERNWKEIARCIGTRSASQCSQRWRRLQPGMRRRPWSEYEDIKLKNLVEVHGTNWSKISSTLGSRSGKQCRDRYLNNLDPSIKRSPWQEDEDQLLIDKYNQIGPRWTEIAKFLTGRPENMVKNRFYTFARHKIFSDAQPTSANLEDQSNEIDMMLNEQPVKHQHTLKNTESLYIPEEDPLIQYWKGYD